MANGNIRIIHLFSYSLWIGISCHLIISTLYVLLSNRDARVRGEEGEEVGDGRE